MDSTRDVDLTMLLERINNRSLPMVYRRRAWTSFGRIREQARDRYLTQLRRRLVRAQVAGDSIQAEKIGEQVYAYTLKRYGR